MGRMSKKRFCKLIMALGWSRNAAQAIARCMRDTPGGYAAAYEKVKPFDPQIVKRVAEQAQRVMDVCTEMIGTLNAAITKAAMGISEWVAQVNTALVCNRAGPDGN